MSTSISHRHLANDRMKGDRYEEKEEEKKSMRFFAYVCFFTNRNYGDDDALNQSNINFSFFFLRVNFSFSAFGNCLLFFLNYGSSISNCFAAHQHSHKVFYSSVSQNGQQKHLKSAAYLKTIRLNQINRKSL
jgi:hypothetical protein